MNKLILVAVLLLTVSALSFAQSTTANVTASVTATLTITEAGTLAFGNIPQGGTVTVLSKAAGAPLFTISGAAGASTTVTVTPPTSLETSPVTVPLTFNATAPSWGTTNVQANSTYYAAISGVMASQTSSGTGNLYVWVGGGVTATPTQATGSYSGTITVSVAQP